MGTNAGAAVRARRRASARHIEHLIAQRDKRASGAGDRATRIKTAVRDGRHAFRRLIATQAAVRQAEVRVGTCLARITADGVPVRDAIAALGLGRAAGRRLLQAAAKFTAESTADRDVARSTDPTGCKAPSASPGHRGIDTPNPSGATERGPR